MANRLWLSGGSTGKEMPLPIGPGFPFSVFFAFLADKSVF